MICLCFIDTEQALFKKLLLFGFFWCCASGEARVIWVKRYQLHILADQYVTSCGGVSGRPSAQRDEKVSAHELWPDEML